MYSNGQTHRSTLPYGNDSDLALYSDILRTAFEDSRLFCTEKKLPFLPYYGEGAPSHRSPDADLHSAGINVYLVSRHHSAALPTMDNSFQGRSYTGGMAKQNTDNNWVYEGPEIETLSETIFDMLVSLVRRPDQQTRRSPTADGLSVVLTDDESRWTDYFRNEGVRAPDRPHDVRDEDPPREMLSNNKYMCGFDRPFQRYISIKWPNQRLGSEARRDRSHGRDRGEIDSGRWESRYLEDRERIVASSQQRPVSERDCSSPGYFSETRPAKEYGANEYRATAGPGSTRGAYDRPRAGSTERYNRRHEYDRW